MKALIALPLALGIGLAAHISAYAGPIAYGPAHHYRAIHHRSVVALAQASATAAVLAPATRNPTTFELEGLSRNPDDCVKYGCVGNN
jgi:hypothetical protein